jgi:hypothetical protein
MIVNPPGTLIPLITDDSLVVNTLNRGNIAIMGLTITYSVSAGCV